MAPNIDEARRAALAEEVRKKCEQNGWIAGDQIDAARDFLEYAITSVVDGTSAGTMRTFVSQELGDVTDRAPEVVAFVGWIRKEIPKLLQAEQGSAHPPTPPPPPPPPPSGVMAIPMPIISLPWPCQWCQDHGYFSDCDLYMRQGQQLPDGMVNWCSNCRYHAGDSKKCVCAPAGSSTNDKLWHQVASDNTGVIKQPKPKPNKPLAAELVSQHWVGEPPGEAQQYPQAFLSAPLNFLSVPPPKAQKKKWTKQGRPMAQPGPSRTNRAQANYAAAQLQPGHGQAKPPPTPQYAYGQPPVPRFAQSPAFQQQGPPQRPVDVHKAMQQAQRAANAHAQRMGYADPTPFSAGSSSAWPVQQPSEPIEQTPIEMWEELPAVASKRSVTAADLAVRPASAKHARVGDAADDDVDMDPVKAVVSEYVGQAATQPASPMPEKSTSMPEKSAAEQVKEYIASKSAPPPPSPQQEEPAPPLSAPQNELDDFSRPVDDDTVIKPDEEAMLNQLGNYKKPERVRRRRNNAAASE